MSKIEKKKNKIKDRIKTLEDEMTLSLTKKTSSTKEIDVPTQTRNIQDLRKQLNNL